MNRNKSRKTRHARIRRKVVGTAKRPRMNVHRSIKALHVQLIDDAKSVTVVSVSSLEPDLKKAIKGKSQLEIAKEVGKIAAERALDKKVKSVIFDRGGYAYHGRVKAIAEGAREAGLQF